MCLFEKRTVDEVISICKLEPSSKNIYVEGISGKLVIDNFLKKQKKSDISVYNIDCIDFNEVFAKLPHSKLNILKDSNKEKVAYLAFEVENCHFLGIIDRDLDFVNNHVKSGKYLSYTDYNSMEIYLFSYDNIDALLKNSFRITTNVNVDNFMKSIGDVCRVLFYIRACLESSNGSIVDFKKNLSYNRKNNACSLDIEKYINKIAQANRMVCSFDGLYKEIQEKLAKSVDDIRLEIKGHDFIKVLYFSICKHKKVSMDESELANTFWVYLDDRVLLNEPLFQRICNL